MAKKKTKTTDKKNEDPVVYVGGVDIFREKASDFPDFPAACKAVIDACDQRLLRPLSWRNSGKALKICLLSKEFEIIPSSLRSVHAVNADEAMERWQLLTISDLAQEFP